MTLHTTKPDNKRSPLIYQKPL